MMIAVFVAWTATVLLAWVLARRRPEHRPIALLLSAGLAVDAALLAFDASVIAPLRAELGTSVPWTGWARVAGHLADAVWLVAPAALSATALSVFANRKPWPSFAAWAIFVSAMVIRHPFAGDGSLARWLSTAQVSAVVVATGLLFAWVRRATRPATSAQFSLTMIVMVEATSLLGAWWAGPFERWDLSQVLNVVGFAVLFVAQGGFLWTSRSSSDSAAAS